MAMAQLTYTPVKWLAVLARSIIKGHDRLFISQGIFTMCFEVGSDFMHILETIEQFYQTVFLFLSMTCLLPILIAIVLSPRRTLTCSGIHPSRLFSCELCGFRKVGCRDAIATLNCSQHGLWIILSIWVMITRKTSGFWMFQLYCLGGLYITS